ncbi:uncharacterized protein LOC101853245 [Aplysia californica]|uniref:Uncharacterized protein LOC101853245 n=1 Tax=Aplysia californica TaxID=6500 RepID=A0ABM1VW91_APLCA|nr:uncharacterized protein LOC101853245 [Aplysia californica]
MLMFFCCCCCNRQVMCPSGGKYQPRSSLYVGGASQKDWGVITRLSKCDVALQGFVDTLYLSGVGFTYKMATLLDKNGHINTLGYSLADHVTEVYEHEESVSILRCGVPAGAVHVRYVKILWLKNAVLLQSSPGADIVEAESDNQSVSELSLQPGPTSEGVYACVLNRDGILSVLHVFLLFRYGRGTKGAEESRAEWVGLILVVLLLLLCFCPCLVYYCTKKFVNEKVLRKPADDDESDDSDDIGGEKGGDETEKDDDETEKDDDETEKEEEDAPLLSSPAERSSKDRASQPGERIRKSARESHHTDTTPTERHSKARSSWKDTTPTERHSKARSSRKDTTPTERHSKARWSHGGEAVRKESKSKRRSSKGKASKSGEGRRKSSRHSRRGTEDSLEMIWEGTASQFSEGMRDARLSLSAANNEYTQERGSGSGVLYDEGGRFYKPSPLESLSEVHSFMARALDDDQTPETRSTSLSSRQTSSNRQSSESFAQQIKISVPPGTKSSSNKKSETSDGCDPCISATLCQDVAEREHAQCADSTLPPIDLFSNTCFTNSLIRSMRQAQCTSNNNINNGEPEQNAGNFDSNKGSTTQTINSKSSSKADYAVTDALSSRFLYYSEPSPPASTCSDDFIAIANRQTSNNVYEASGKVTESPPSCTDQWSVLPDIQKHHGITTAKRQSCAYAYKIRSSKCCIRIEIDELQTCQGYQGKIEKELSDDWRPVSQWNRCPRFLVSTLAPFITFGTDYKRRRPRQIDQEAKTKDYNSGP